ncbi:protein gp37 [Massilia sp. PDC64]|nr:protein gp37 [Massilia sp. PDC64]
MAENSAIEWTDHTFNPWEGCQKVSPGCDHCYAETRNARFAGGAAVNWGPGAPRRRTSASNWNKPLAWNAAHAEFFAQHGRRQRVFCASLADVFDNQVDPAWRADLLELIDRTPNLDWLLLTKRIGNVADMLPNGWLMEHTNVWLGASIVNQVEADRDIPKLVALHAAVKFLSMEPLLGPVDLRGNLPGERALRWYRPMLNMLDWVIVGGESGPAARPMHPDWARDLRDQCTAAGVPFLFKQWGEWLPATEGRSVLGKTLILEGAAPLPDKPQWHGFEGGQQVARVGKKAAGRQLDGAQHDGYPSAKSGTF